MQEPPHPAKHPFHHLDGNGRDVTDPPEREVLERRGKLWSHAGKVLHGMRREEHRLVPLAHVHEPRSLRCARGDLADQLARGQPHRRLKAHTLTDLALDPDAGVPWRAEQPLAPRVVNEGLIQPRALDEGRADGQHAEDRVGGALKERGVEGNHARARAQAPRLGECEPRPHAVGARLVRGGDHGAAAMEVTHDNGTMSQGAIAQTRHGGVEIVGVDVKDMALHGGLQSTWGRTLRLRGSSSGFSSARASRETPSHKNKNGEKKAKRVFKKKRAPRAPGRRRPLCRINPRSIPTDPS